MPRDTLHILCPAKVNLALSVGAPREEDGLHPICSWMTAVGFHDSMTLRRSTDNHSSFDIRWAEDAPVPQEVDWPLTQDLAYRAHALFEEHLDRKFPVCMRLEKKIPAGAGLGGGSGNAAGMIIGLNKLFAIGLDQGTLFRMCQSLGADTWFMYTVMHMQLSDALVSGVGDEIQSEGGGFGRVFQLVLILPGLHCSTPAVYHQFDQLTANPSVNVQRVKDLADMDYPESSKLFNDLSEAAFAVEPALREAHGLVQNAVGQPVHISGSGSSMFVIVDNEEEGKSLAVLITDRTGLAAIYAESNPSKYLGHVK